MPKLCYHMNVVGFFFCYNLCAFKITFHGAVVMIQCVVGGHHLWWLLFYVPVAPLPIQFPAGGLGKAMEDGPRVWDPAICVGDPNWASSFWLFQLSGE